MAVESPDLLQLLTPVYIHDPNLDSSFLPQLSISLCLSSQRQLSLPHLSKKVFVDLTQSPIWCPQRESTTGTCRWQQLHVWFYTVTMLQSSTHARIRRIGLHGLTSQTRTPWALSTPLTPSVLSSPVSSLVVQS